ncbi:MAG: leucine-rich repeat protein [Dysgonamonadaceae bacterium]|nr:leucine-rich repeat protein [Dysgonamonadaceae bacterium]
MINKNSFSNKLKTLLGGAFLKKSAACDILSFSVNGTEWDIIDTGITHIFPAKTAKMRLMPVIALSPGATVNPLPGAVQDFFQKEGVAYTVTAEDGVTTKTYVVKATRAPYALCDIVSFSVNGEKWDIVGTDITHNFPAETEKTRLTPVIALSPGATVNPLPGAAQDLFRKQGVAYTVTAEDGVTTKTYIVKAIRTPYALCDIVSFGVNGEEWGIVGTDIAHTFPAGTEKTRLTPTIVLSPGATVKPLPGATQDYFKEQGIPYTVTAEDGVTTKTYIVKATKALRVKCDIISFVVNGEEWDIIGANIIHTFSEKTVKTRLSPAIALSPGATVSPLPGAAQDFFQKQGVPYTVTAEDGVTTKTYIAKATKVPCALCDILSFSVNDRKWDIAGTDITHTFPSRTAKTRLIPAIILSPGATVNPLPGAAQDFFQKRGVAYTVTAEDGVTKKMYIVKSTVQAIDSGMIDDYTWALTGVAGNYTLTIDGSGAMKNHKTELPWHQYRNGITAIVIHGVSTISNGAFEDCSSLTAITVSNSVTAIGEDAFMNCSSLTSLTIPKSVTKIGAMAFYGCSSLTSLTIPDSITTIGDGAFERCSSLTSVIIPNSVTTIGDGAFSGCSGLTSLTIPGSVTAIGNDAFSDCRGLTAIRTDAANKQYSSENGVLFNKYRTKLVCYPAGKTGRYVIPNSVTMIGNDAFLGCSGVTSVTISNSVTTIGDMTFLGCSGLTSVTIPNSVTTIGAAFSDCSSLTEIHIDAANKQYRSENGILFNKKRTKLVCYPAGKTGSYVIPDSVTAIDSHAFWHCSGLTSLTIPSSVTTIGDTAFNLCTGLTTVTNLNPVPQNIGSNVFLNVKISDCTLKVPAGTVDAYKAAPAWSGFGRIVRA